MKNEVFPVILINKDVRIISDSVTAALQCKLARRSNQSILKEISPGCSLEGLMLKLKLQYYQAPLSMESSKQAYWSGLPFPSPGDLPYAGIKSWVGRRFTIRAPRPLLNGCLILSNAFPHLLR